MTAEKCERKYKRKKFFKKILIYILIIVFAAICLLIYFEHKLYPVVCAVASRKADAIATRAINESVCEEIQKRGIKYDSIVTLEKDSSGKITALTTDIAQLNSMKSFFSLSILNHIEEVGKTKITIPLGSVAGSSYFAGKGPGITVYICPVSSVFTDFENQFLSQGINQTLHRIVMNVDVSVSVFMPIHSQRRDISTSVCIAETVIIGDVPQAYTKVEDTDGENADIADEINDYGAHNFID